MSKQREIKFRCWNPSTKEMFSWMQMGEDNWDLWNEFLRAEHMMQYTGYKDIKDNEIYDGDLVVTHDKSLTASSTKVFGIKWSGSGFVIYNPHCCDVCKNGDGCIGNLDEFGNQYEVIGNIYEHPELIKP